MGIFARILGFFASCIRPSTSSTASSSLNNEDSRLFRPNADSLQSNVASTSTAGLNYGIKNISVSNDRVREFLPYNEDNCELLPGTHQILCKNVKRDEMLGSGSAHIKNIARVLELKDPPDVYEIQAENIVIIYLSNVHSNHHHICKEVVQHLLRGLYYRRKASEAAAVRMEWKNKIATLGKLLGTTRQRLRICRNSRDHFGYLMNSYNREACDELFKFFNFHRDVSVVDLHCLHVADEKKLELLRLDLVRRSGHSEKVDDMIQYFKAEGDEAIRKLKVTLENFDLEEAIKNNTPWLEIIVGAGHHSRNNEQHIRPKVEKLLKERKLKFAAVNKGLLVVTFLTYSGPEPCFGEYYCENCNFCWKSSKSYVGKYQKCAHCKVNCWPVKQREKGKNKKKRKGEVVNYHRDGAGPVKCPNLVNQRN